ncbi:MAG: transposase [Abditibacteriota bacterium]|nr:transposase [Abditibacteriota bacterium]
MMGIPYRIAEEAFDISRTYYYDLGKKADCVLERLCASEQTTERVIALNKAFRERLVVALTCYGMSAANITAFAEEMFAYSISSGTIWNILKEKSRKAETLEKSVSLENVKHIATDEVFQNGEPVLTGADLDTGYVFLAQAAPDRSAETWKAALEEKKTRGLNPELNVSDGGSGLVKGVREAFPEVETQLDIFHALRDLGNGVRSVEEAEIRRLSKLFDLEYRMETQKTYLPTKQEYDLMRQNTPLRLLQSDSLRILYDWLREYTAFSGRNYQESVSLCEWILDEMAALYPKRDNLQKQIRRFRRRLPDLLAFLPRLQRDMKAMASVFHTPEYAFPLLYRQRAWDYRSEEYRLMEKKLCHIFEERLPEARETLTGMIRRTYRASSPDENVNGRLRVFMNARRGVPSWQFPLYQMFLNMKKAKRSRRPERIGTSALERLTGQSHPNFLDALLGPPSYILSAR